MRFLSRRKYRPMKAVAEFHAAFGVVNEVTEGSKYLRACLIAEEFEEALAELGFMVIDSTFFGNDQPLNDALLTKELADLLYVIYGTAVTFDLPLQEAFNEVHRSNMSKLGADGKPIYREDGKVMKGENYIPADIEQVLDAYSKKGENSGR